MNAPETSGVALLPDDGNPLYNAAVNYMVSKRTERDAWDQVARFVQHHIEANTTAEEMQAIFGSVERQIKADFKVTAMPTAWRSAKSTALGAVSQGLTLVSAAGVVVPKTGLSKALQTRKKPVPRNTYQALLLNLRQAVGHAVKLNAEPPILCPDKNYALSEVATLRKAIEELPCA